MDTLSYNEATQRRLKFRHIFVPGAYGFLCEVVIGVVALLSFNAIELSNKLTIRNFNNTDPLPIWSKLFRNTLDTLQNHYAVQQLLLFLFWGVAGALLYILVFRLAQLAFGVEHSFKFGFKAVRKDRARGLVRWLSSLHDFFITSIIVMVGGILLLFGSFVCFGIASQELRNGLNDSLPGSFWELLISLVAAVLSVRLIALGLSLLSPRFRTWYTT